MRVHAFPQGSQFFHPPVRGGRTSGVYVSKDTGRTWTSTLPLWFSETQGRANGFTLIQDSSSPEHLIVATAGEGIHRSEDFGQP